MDELSSKYFEKYWGSNTTREEYWLDYAVRGSCIYELANPELKRAERECKGEYCREGMEEAEMVEERSERMQEVFRKWCPELMDELKGVLEEGVV